MIELYPPEKYYSKVPLGGPLQGQLHPVGHFFWAPVLKTVERNPTTELRARYNSATKNYDIETARAGCKEFDESREPVKELDLRAKERALIVPAKKRPVIVVSTHLQPPDAGGRKFGDACLVAPLYSFEGDEHKASYPEPFIERVKGYVYEQFFYVPACSDPYCKEGFVRFDRIQPINKNWLEHRGSALSDDMLEYFQIWLWHFLGAELVYLSEKLFLYREAKMKALGLTTGK